MFRFGVVATIPELLEVVCFAREFAFGASRSLEHLVLCLIVQGGSLTCNYTKLNIQYV